MPQLERTFVEIARPRATREFSRRGSGPAISTGQDSTAWSRRFTTLAEGCCFATCR